MQKWDVLSDCTNKKILKDNFVWFLVINVIKLLYFGLVKGFIKRILYEKALQKCVQALKIPVF